MQSLEWRPLTLDEACIQHIRLMIDFCGGNRKRAAQMLGIGRTSLYRYLKKGKKVSGPAPLLAERQIHLRRCGDR